MTSTPTPEGIDALRSMPEAARSDLQHLVNNAGMIISGLAQQLLEHSDDCLD